MSNEEQVSVEQMNDWIEHPEKYDISTDDDYAQFLAWCALVGELNGLFNESGEVVENYRRPKKTKQPTRQQLIVKTNELRGRLVD
jgi:hypothetical protein